MIDLLIEYFEKHVVLDQNEIDFLVESVPVRKVEKNEFLLSEGDVSTEFYFVLEGCIRLFYTNDIEEKTAFFYLENSFVSSYSSFIKQLPAAHNLQSIEESTIAVVSVDAAYKLVEKYPKFEFLARVMMEEELIVYQEIISTFVQLNAEQRYLKLIESNSPLLHRIPQHQLATFLGVTPETLSRIRKRIVSK